ncbi:MAG: SDR family oxidoreductase [Gammaproteobacteria bacterium]|nr:SDR family oxidoreductase [Gammaproteobacteria bacterium]
MTNFSGRLAVITGGGAGMGRELVRQLAAEGCHVAMCDLNEANMTETRELALADAPTGTRVSSHRCDVSEPDQIQAFRDAVLEAHETDHIHLLFNNAGIGGGGSFVKDPVASWEKTFNICWGGVYHCCRAFLPALLAADAGHIVNTSSINGFWASIGPQTPHTAYSAAKFAVKGFSEALITDLRINAPHIGVSVVMPGHIGTSIVANSGVVLGRSPEQMTSDEIGDLRDQLAATGLPVGNLPDDAIRELIRQRARDFRDNAPTSAAEAANVIIEGVRAGRWRILVGEDAGIVDHLVRSDPEAAYEPGFVTRMMEQGHLQQLMESTGSTTRSES